MAKNQNKKDLNNLTSSFSARYLELSSSFAGKKFFGKLIVSVLMVLALLAFALEGFFMLLSSLFSAVVAITGDKSTVRMSQGIRKNNPKAFKQVLNGVMARDGLDNFSRIITSSIGGKLDVELHNQLSTLTKRATLKRYFKLLKIKDKSAFVLVKSSSCQKLLTQYDKSYGSVMELEQHINAAKVAKKASKKKAKNTRNKVLNVTSWSKTRKP